MNLEGIKRNFQREIEALKSISPDEIPESTISNYDGGRIKCLGAEGVRIYLDKLDFDLEFIDKVYTKLTAGLIMPERIIPSSFIKGEKSLYVEAYGDIQFVRDALKKGNEAFGLESECVFTFETSDPNYFRINLATLFRNVPALKLDLEEMASRGEGFTTRSRLFTDAGEFPMRILFHRAYDGGSVLRVSEMRKILEDPLELKMFNQEDNVIDYNLTYGAGSSIVGSRYVDPKGIEKNRVGVSPYIRIGLFSDKGGPKDLQDLERLEEATEYLFQQINRNYQGLK